MRKYKHVHYLALFVGIIFASCANRTLNVHQARFKHFQYATDSAENVFSKKFASTKWYYDSSIIYEVRPIMFGEMKKTNGEYYDREKFVYYRFVDLRTMRGQEYLDLRDTSKPVCGYQFPFLNGPVNYNSILTGTVSNMAEPESTKLLSDTVIGNEQVKRIELVFSAAGGLRDSSWRQIVYFRKGEIPHFMRIETSVELEGYYVWMTEGKSKDEESNFGDFVGIEVEARRLDESILEIFKAWRRNANSITLPLSPYINELKPCDMISELYFKNDSGFNRSKAIKGEGNIEIINRNRGTGKDSTRQQNLPEDDRVRDSGGTPALPE